MSNKLYKGWELIKLLSEGKIIEGTRIQQYIDGQLDRYLVYTVRDNTLWTNEGHEACNSMLIDKGFEFEIIEENKQLLEKWRKLIGDANTKKLDKSKLFYVEYPDERFIYEDGKCKLVKKQYITIEELLEVLEKEVKLNLDNIFGQGY